MADREPKVRSEEPLAHTVQDASRRSKCGRTLIYSEIRSGALKARKVGRRTINLDEDLKEWLRSLPTRAVA